jgi:predicted dehydrogenase
MVGMVEGNGHPFSWSAIINGRYDSGAMMGCGYPVIPQYLDAQPPSALGIPGVDVTHIWCDRPEDAAHVAGATFIPHVVDRPTDVIGQVDAVMIPTDIGGEHFERARPFIEAGLPVFIDKPLVDRECDLRQFVRWYAEGSALMTSSCMRYAREFIALRSRLHEVGQPRLVTVTMFKDWHRYGIHALESLIALDLKTGWRSIIQNGDDDFSVSHITRFDELHVVVIMSQDMYGGFGCMNVYGTEGHLSAKFEDTFAAFKAQLEAFVAWLRTGNEPFPFSETADLMKLLIGGLNSRALDGNEIMIDEIGAAET